MRNITKYITAGFAAAYLALAGADAQATSGYEQKFKNYTPQLIIEAPIFEPVIIRADKKETPLDVILNVSDIERLEAPVPIRHYKPSFMPIPERLKEMEKNKKY